MAPTWLCYLTRFPFLMKKTVYLLALLAGLSRAAQAQHRNASLGLKAGASLTNVGGADVGSTSNIYGFHGGIFVNIGLTDLLAFQPELLYSQKGTKALTTAGDYRTERFHYADVPLVLHVNANGLFFEAGPQVGFLVIARDEYRNSTFTADRSSYKTVDLGYVAGLGYQRKTGLGAGLRYNGAFTDYRQPYVFGNNSYQTRARHSAFQLYLTYSFAGR